MEESLYTWAVNQGFAVVVALFSLIRLEKTMKDNTAIIQKLLNKLERDDDNVI